jgi:ABC-type transport system involved in multi-copper enzyme maturation permease subunit
MTTLVASRPTSSVGSSALPAARPTFLGVLRGELFKLTRQRLNYFLVLLVSAVALLPYVAAIFFVDRSQTLQSLQNPPQLFLFDFMSATLDLQRVFVGIFLLVATARMVGLEYQNGTIRVLLARGVGRLELLGAKLTAMALAGLALFAWGILLNAIGTVVMVRNIAGNFDPINALSADFWKSTGVMVLTVLISMGVSILLAASVTIVTRSLSFGLSGALGWFAADNIGVLFLLLIYRFTQNDFWINVSGYLLGPELNNMPATVVPWLTITGTIQGQVVSKATPPLTMGIPPLVNYDGAHALVIALVYGVVFAAAAVLVMWRRDVLE